MRENSPQLGDGRNNPWLDLIRCVAILLVLCRHGERAFHHATGEPLGPVGTVFINGWVGVDIFFVLSGYLIARHLAGAGIGSGRFRIGRYLAMRGLRIVPAYLAVLALILVGAFPLYTIVHDNLPYRIAYHLLFLQDYLPSDINIVFWSLGVEEKFYLLAPFLMFGLLRCRTASAQALILVVLFALPPALRAYSYQTGHGAIEYAEFFQIFRSPFHMAMDGLVVGVGVAIVQQNGLLPASRHAGSFVLFVSMGALLIWLASGDFIAEIGAIDAVAQPSIIALLAGLMTLGAVQLSGARMPLARPVRCVSRLSYCLYLVHFPLIPMVTALASPHGSLAFWTFYIVASFFAAFLVHRGIERPFLDWKDRIAARAPVSAVPRAEASKTVAVG